MKCYAQLNENKICIGISQVGGEIIRDNLIEISSVNMDYMWKKYENGVWSTETFEPASTAPIDDIEKLKQENIEMKQALSELTNVPILSESYTLEEYKEYKIKLLSIECNKFVLSGFDFEINGEIKHFSMNEFDQIKLLGLASVVKDGAEIVSWHYNDGECIDMAAQTFTSFFAVGSVLVSYMTTKFNTGLRPYIRKTELTKDEINAIEVGFTLPEEYQEKVLDKAAKGVGKTVDAILPIINAYGW